MYHPQGTCTPGWEPLVYCMRIPSRKTAKQTCGSWIGSVCGIRTETMQKNKNILNSLAAEIHKSKRNAASNSEKVVQP